MGNVPEIVIEKRFVLKCGSKLVDIPLERHAGELIVSQQSAVCHVPFLVHTHLRVIFIE